MRGRGSTKGVRAKEGKEFVFASPWQQRVRTLTRLDFFYEIAVAVGAPGARGGGEVLPALVTKVLLRHGHVTRGGTK